VNESYWPADRGAPLAETTCGDVLREAAGAVGDTVALVAGVSDPARRRRWTYGQLFAEAQTAARALLGRFDPGERVAVWAPNNPQWTVLQFGAALAGLILVTVNPLNRDRELAHVLRQSRAAGVFLVPEVRGVSTVDILNRVRPQLPHLRERVLFSGVPTMLYALLDHPDFARRDLSRVRIAFSGGALVPPQLVRRVHHTLGIPFAIVYAQTEASPVITGTRPTDSADDQAETVGRPFPHTEVRIADAATGATVPVGQVGEVCTRGYHVMTGYFDDPDATAQAIDADGWLHTGDLGRLDERGYCRVEGRVKEMMIRGGENIYPREIELVLLEHPGVADVAVVGVPDQQWGEHVAAFIRPAGDAPPAPADLDAFCRRHLAPFKVPRYWVTVDAYPMTPSGKIQKYLLREQFVAGTANPEER
jgi:acyl-CoA synthetase (AMP-forming)/AMP-acid ligase II